MANEYPSFSQMAAAPALVDDPLLKAELTTMVCVFGAGLVNLSRTVVPVDTYVNSDGVGEHVPHWFT